RVASMSTASPAATSIKSSSTRPAAPSGFFRAKRTIVVHVPARARARAGTAISTRLTAIAHPRVENAVEHVDEQIAEDDDDGDEHDEVLHDRIVAPENRLDQEARDPRQIEDRLGDPGAADEKRELDADDRDDREQRVLERVPPDDDAPGLSLGPRRADVVLTHHLEQGRAGDAHDQRRGAIG